MRVLALVTARGGSKRVPGKNIRPLGGIPLIAWSIRVCSGIAEIVDVLVSTDDPATAEIASEEGAMVPWLRPRELATDTATSVDVAVHAIDWYESVHGAVDGLLLLQPTSPFRGRDSIERALATFAGPDRRPIVGVSPAKSHPSWCYRVDGDKLLPFTQQEGKAVRSQDLQPAYCLNGAIYLVTPSDLRQRRSFVTDDAVPLLMEEPPQGIDIDTEMDWEAAEAMSARVPRYPRLGSDANA